MAGRVAGAKSRCKKLILSGASGYGLEGPWQTLKKREWAEGHLPCNGMKITRINNDGDIAQVEIKLLWDQGDNSDFSNWYIKWHCFWQPETAQGRRPPELPQFGAQYAAAKSKGSMAPLKEAFTPIALGRYGWAKSQWLSNIKVH